MDAAPPGGARTARAATVCHGLPRTARGGYPRGATPLLTTVNEQLVPFLAVTSVVMVVPGPSVLFAVTQRLRSGPRAGLLAVLGLESGLTVHVAAACLGLSAAVAASEGLLRALQVSGAAYLAWLGVGVLRRPTKPHTGAGAQTSAEVPGSLVRVYLSGVLVDLLNPKTVLFFVAILPQFVRTGSGTVATQSVLLGACCVVMALLVDGGYAALAGRVQRHGLPASAGRWAEVASGCSFLGLAAWTLTA